MNNLLSFDIEDWFQSTYNFDRSISNRVDRNTRKLLEILAPFDAKATFFVQGMVAQKFPELIKEIHKQGHELASHAHSHRPINKMTAPEFEEELKISLDLIEQQTGEKVVGFRAPDFSIDRSNPWAFEVLKKQGIIYDSSIFPKRTSRYGVDDFSLDPVRLEPFGIYEIPLSLWSFWGRKLPVAGGGYLRLFPYSLTRRAIHQLNKTDKRAAVVYMHPYEINTRDFIGEDIPLKLRLHQGLFRSQMRPRLVKLLQDFKFISCIDLVKTKSNWASVNF